MPKRQKNNRNNLLRNNLLLNSRQNSQKNSVMIHMAKAPLYNVNAERIGDIDLPDAVFGVPPKESVVHQVYVAQMANARRPWADTKRRGEVSGGGKKPWKQKGTGRARHGSIRSPIWKGGGVVFGPLSERNYSQKINKKMNRAAVRMCLSDKVLNDRILVVESLPMDGKTKTFFQLRSKLPGAGKSTVVMTPAGDAMILRASRNVERVDVVRASDITVTDLLNHQYLVATIDAIGALRDRFATPSRV